MSTATRAPKQSSFTTRNPALSTKAFEGQIARAEAKGETGMTATGTYLKTGFLFLLFLATAFFGWQRINVVEGVIVDVNLIWLISSFVSVIALGFVSRFAGRYIWIVAIIYSLVQGVVTGMVAHVFEAQFPGIVIQAALITLSLYVTAWALYTFGVIKVTKGYRTMVMIGTIGVGIFLGVNLLLALFGIQLNLFGQGSWLSIAVAAVILLFAVRNLPIDVDFVRQASAAGAPKFMEWQGAFGLIVTIIWLFMAVLRLLGATRSR